MSSVDVIVPCYLYGHFLRQCVESVLMESTLKVRVLIIDDASPDNTAEVGSALAKEDSRVTFLRHDRNKGHIATYNEGIEWVSADYMALLSADDYLVPGALKRAANLMDGHPEVGFVFGRGIVLADNSASTETEAVPSSADKTGWRILTGLEFIELSGSHNIVHTPTVMVRTELQKRLGGYRPELPHTGDMEMWLRFAAQASVGILEEYQAVNRRHAGNMSLKYRAKGFLPDIEQRKAALDCFFQVYGDQLPNAQQVRRRLFRSLGCDAVELASSAFNEGDMETSKLLSEFSLVVCSDVKGSLPWLRLAVKRSMGYEMWRTLQPAVAGVWQGILSLKRLVN